MDFLVGVRLREPLQADDYLAAEDVALHVGDLVVVETGTGTAVGEVRRPRRELPASKRDRPFRRVRASLAHNVAPRLGLEVLLSRLALRVA